MFFPKNPLLIKRIVPLCCKGYHSESKKAIELAETRYNVKRGCYAAPNEADTDFFCKLLGSSHVLTSPDDTQSFNIDYLHSVRGNSKIILKPENAEEISEILKYCNERKLAVCPQGGNTGLVGGSVPIFDEIVLSLQRLNKIQSVDEVTGIVVSESGCVLDNLDNEAKKHGLTVPLDLGSKASCQIGGNVSTNVGGLKVIRYGNLHGLVLGLEVVLANGKILDLMSNFKKDNTGYHLKHLFIGSEGTLGVVTKVAILCPPASQSVHVAFIGLPSYDAVLKTFLNAKRCLGEILSACEMMDELSFKTNINVHNLNSPIEGYPFYMLVETSGSNVAHDEEKIHKFLNIGLETGDICDGTITSEPGKMNEIWKIRELIPDALMAPGYCFKYDVSLPLRCFYSIVLTMRERMENMPVAVSGYGHLGDSNIHLNISCNEFTQEIYKKIEPFVYEFTSQLKGSVSAEHGLGFLKKQYLKFSKSNEAIDLMKDIKKLLDPNGILNPYKVLSQH